MAAKDPTPYAEAPPPSEWVNPYPKNWMGIVALVAPFAAGLVPGATIAAIVFGHLSLAAVKRGEANNRGLGLAGLILGYVFTAVGILAAAAYVGLLGFLIAECVSHPDSVFCD